MKKNYYFIAFIFLFVLTLIHCSKDVNDINSIEETVNESVITKETLLNFTKNSVIDFDDTGVNFYIEKDSSFSTRSVDNGESFTQLILKTELTNRDIVEAKLLYEFKENGEIKITHYSEEMVFAILYFSKKGELYNLDIPNEGTSTRSIKSWYSCVNKKYQEIRKKIASDMLNDIACNVFSVPCAIMSAASAIDKC